MTLNHRMHAKKAMIFVTAAHLISRRCGVCAFRATPSSRLSNNNNNYLGLFSSQIARSSIGQTNTNGIHSTTSSHYNYFSLPSLITTRIKDQTTNGDDNSSVEPTWNYVPYKTAPPKRKPTNNPNRRRFSTAEWTVPTRIPIPEDKLQISFAKASGAGGQNVNKVETKVELRFHVDSAAWIPAEVRDRLKTNEPNRINNEGYLSVNSQEHRTQLGNRKDALKKLETILKTSWVRPKVRRMRKGLSKKAKEGRRDEKKKNSVKKESRRKVDF